MTYGLAANSDDAVSVPLEPSDTETASSAEITGDTGVTGSANLTGAPTSVGVSPAALAMPVATREFNRLIEVEGGESRATTMQLLFGVWDAPSINGQCDAAEAVNLRCLTLLGSLRDLAHLNRPALVELNIASLPHFLVVTRVQDDGVTLISDAGTYQIKAEDMLQSWNGYFTLLWRPPAGFRLLQQGDEGPLVGLLKAQLRTVDDAPFSSPSSNRFDTELTDRLKRFQLSRGLRPDGIAGEQTWIHLNSAAGNAVPKLTDLAGGAG